MNCPYCNKEMETGYIKSGALGLIWEEPKKAGTVRFGKNTRKMIPLLQEKSNPLLGYTLASICTTCQKVIIDYEQS